MAINDLQGEGYRRSAEAEKRTRLTSTQSRLVDTHFDDDRLRVAQELLHRVAQLPQTQVPVVLEQRAHALRLHQVIARTAPSSALQLHMVCNLQSS